MEFIVFRKITALTFLGLALVAGACSDDNGNGPGKNAFVRVVHASPDAPSVDVLVDDQVVLSDVQYQEFSGYLTVPKGMHNIKVNVAGGGATVIDADVDLAAGEYYTAIASNLAASITPLVLVDDLKAPPAGNAKVRLVHGAPSAGLVDIYVTAPGADISTLNPNVANFGFQDETGYIDLPVGTYQVQVTLAGTKTVAIDTGALPLPAGFIATAIAVEAPGGGAPYAALLMEDTKN
ncbi:MAG: DUF4397 domain-containing protein [Candidatus Aminicenantes bacterium]|nr:MAG: DUF4397 domain-containing protein [Candidatus Aminicenantes bacterium]